MRRRRKLTRAPVADREEDSRAASLEAAQDRQMGKGFPLTLGDSTSPIWAMSLALAGGAAQAEAAVSVTFFQAFLAAGGRQRSAKPSRRPGLIWNTRSPCRSGRRFGAECFGWIFRGRMSVRIATGRAFSNSPEPVRSVRGQGRLPRPAGG